MKNREYPLRYKEYADISECPPSWQELILEAKSAMQKAYAPYSKFKVGAAVLLDNGIVVQGNNQENASFPMGSCAERVAVHYAGATYPQAKITAIAIVASNESGILKSPISPCGACRQILLESEQHSKQKITVILHGTDYTQVLPNAHSLLPLSFGSNTL